jgi:3'(2'), 5'-bisphosphate nucleotidase
LLVLDITAGEGWEKLCPFLGKPIPDIPFPKANVTRIRWMDLKRLEEVAHHAAIPLARLHWALTREGAEPPLLARVSALGMAALGQKLAKRWAIDQTVRYLKKALAQLNADIPILSRLNPDTPYAVRKLWNHFWLIDPLDGETALGMTGGGFSVNISLIEDRRPVAGVVYNPVTGETYSGMVGKGTSYSRFGADPRPLDTISDAIDRIDCVSHALTLCRWIVQPHGRTQPLAQSMEWHSAAAHAIARMAGRQLLQADTETEPLYNKPTWDNAALKVL